MIWDPAGGVGGGGGDPALLLMEGISTLLRIASLIID